MNARIESLVEKKFALRSFLFPLQQRYIDYMELHYRVQRELEPAPVVEDATMVEKQVDYDVLKYVVRLTKAMMQDLSIGADFNLPPPPNTPPPLVSSRRD